MGAKCPILIRGNLKWLARATVDGEVSVTGNGARLCSAAWAGAGLGKYRRCLLTCRACSGVRGTNRVKNIRSTAATLL